VPKDYLHILTGELEKLGREDKENILIRLRDEVDKVDEEIGELLIRRIKISLEIGAIKKTMGLSAYDAQREKEIGANIQKQAGDPEIRNTLLKIYERIIDESRAIQKEREK
jgi:chorismate mutase